MIHVGANSNLDLLSYMEGGVQNPFTDNHRSDNGRSKKQNRTNSLKVHGSNPRPREYESSGMGMVISAQSQKAYQGSAVNMQNDLGDDEVEDVENDNSRNSVNAGQREMDGDEDMRKQMVSNKPVMTGA